MKLTEKQLEVVESNGHLLVTGGPGSGKTTVSILKAANIADQKLRSQQKILFLSFARATVSRVVEAIEADGNISREIKSLIEVETYHSLFWSILKTHGYLIRLPRHFYILTPSAEAVALSKIRIGFKSSNKLSNQEKQKVQQERKYLAFNKGLICFDLFAPIVGNLLQGSNRISKLIATRYPYIILDEFQDTNAEQWRVVSELGKCSELIALADQKQQIFEYIGADPKRLDHFRAEFNPTEIDFSDANHRSSGTQIAQFANDSLNEQFSQRQYSGIKIDYLPSKENSALSKLITTTVQSRKRLEASGQSNWSLAILVPTKKMTRCVSDAFRTPPNKLQSIEHSVVIDLEAAILGYDIVAHLLQPKSSSSNDILVDLLCNYFEGRGGNKPFKKDLKESDSFREAHKRWKKSVLERKKIPGNSILIKPFSVCNTIWSLRLTGDPIQDWRTVCTNLERGECKRLQEINKDVRTIRLLERGTQIQTDLGEDWRQNGYYANALEIVRRAFVKEHFATKTKPENGVIIMNMHKAKGKQFDEVIIFEGWLKRKNRIVPGNDRMKVDKGVRQNFLVSVTRSRSRTTILTQKTDPCVLLPP